MSFFHCCCSLCHRPPSLPVLNRLTFLFGAARRGLAPQISRWRIYQGMTNELSFQMPDYLTFIPQELGGEQGGGGGVLMKLSGASLIFTSPLWGETPGCNASTPTWTQIKKEVIKIGRRWGEVIEILTFPRNRQRPGASVSIWGREADEYHTLKPGEENCPFSGLWFKIITWVGLHRALNVEFLLFSFLVLSGSRLSFTDLIARFFSAASLFRTQRAGLLVIFGPRHKKSVIKVCIHMHRLLVMLMQPTYWTCRTRRNLDSDGPFAGSNPFYRSQPTIWDSKIKITLFAW